MNDSFEPKTTYGKIRSQLVRDGGVHPESLFERRRDGSQWMVRIGLSPEAITMSEPSGGGDEED